MSETDDPRKPAERSLGIRSGSAARQKGELALLECGELTLVGQMRWSSNATFLATIHDADRFLLCVYKPRAGEQPLLDFPDGSLCAREVAAFLVSRALGWDLVPTTVLRDGPLGIGAVQRYVPHNPDSHFLNLEEFDRDRAMQIAAFDVVTNNADRKSGHVITDPAGRLWAIDHGLTFSVEPKLRTVIWTFAGESLAAPVMVALQRLASDLIVGGSLRTALGVYLSAAELDALRLRSTDLCEAGRFPWADRERRSVPWPPV